MRQFHFTWCILLYVSYVVSYERPIVVVIPSYNNQEWCIKNLHSVFSQNYTNYRVIYLDDCSNDDMYSRVCAYTKECQQEHRTNIIHNHMRVGALANHYKAVWLCDDEEIIIQLDGDDCLAHPDVLAKINSVYDNPNVWLTYGQYVTDPPDIPSSKSRPMPCFVTEKNGYREYPWITSAPRTFYAWLFKKIRLESLLYHGLFFKTTCDLACMFPMLEMAAGRIYFIPDILYIYNCKTPHNDYKIHLQAQRQAEFAIRAQKKYKPCSLDSLIADKNYTCSCLIIADDTSNALVTLLESLERYVHNLDRCIVVCHDALDDHRGFYQSLEKQYAHIIFIYTTAAQYKQTCIQALETMKTPYVLLAHDRCASTYAIDIQECTKMLAQTHAHGFYLTLGTDATYHPFLAHEQKIPPHTALNDTIDAWQFYTGSYAWREPNTFCMAIYRRLDVLRACMAGRYTTPHALQEVWRQYPVDLTCVGLFFDHSVAQDCCDDDDGV